MKFINSILKLSLVLSVFGFVSMPVVAQEGKIDEQAPDISQLTTAEEILKKTCTYLQQNQSFSVKMDITYDNVLTTGEKVQFAARQKVIVRKPDRIFSEYIGDERHTEFRYDGNKFTLYSPLEKFYVTKETDTTLDQALSNIEANYGVTIPLSNLFISDPCTKIFTEATQVRFIGKNLVRDKEGYHLLLNGSDRNVQIWVSEDEQPLILKAIITYPLLQGEPQYTAVFTDWNFNVRFSDRDFQFNPPQDASAIEFLPPND